MDFKKMKRQPILAGWSSDKKFRLEDASGNKYFLRISDIQTFEEKWQLFQKMKALDVPMNEPLACWQDSEGVHMVFEWVHGEDLRDMLGQFSEREQYRLGYFSGQMLKKIHGLNASEAGDWSKRFNQKVDRNIALYQNSGINVPGAHQLIDYLENNRGLLVGRPQTFHHGDYHVGNMMLREGELVIIDFDRWDEGDSWEEFNRIVWSAQISPIFASAQLHGYFEGNPPLEFFQLLAFYIASNTLGAIGYAPGFGRDEIEVAVNQAREVLLWFDGMENPVPSWYQEYREA